MLNDGEWVARPVFSIRSVVTFARVASPSDDRELPAAIAAVAAKMPKCSPRTIINIFSQNKRMTASPTYFDGRSLTRLKVTVKFTATTVG